MSKQVKLSDKQKEVVRMMREGAIMFRPTSFFVPRGHKIILRTGSDYKELNKRIFNSLMDKNVIYQYKYESSDQSIYRLTSLGKTINID